MCAGYLGGVMRELTADDIQGVCAIYPNRGAIGSPCSSGRDCRGGVCHADGYCTESCVSSGQCPSGYQCVNNQCERESSGASSCPVCGTLPCGDTSSCVGNGELRFCSNPCLGGSDCPRGFVCAEVQGGSRMCWPASKSCSAAGPGPGEACAAGGVCALGNVCLQGSSAPRCYSVCQGAWDCPPGESCMETTDPDLRYCEDTGPTTPPGGESSEGPGSSCPSSGPADTGDTGDLHCADSGGAAPCECDVYYGCDPDCPCDVECVCECDVYHGCDTGCECDQECTGCLNAALLPQRGNPNVSDLSPLLLVLGGLLLYRRRRGSL